MFGYITVYKPELKIKEYDVYKGVYCTLCKEMGKEYGFLSRFILSYDGAFYVLYKMGQSSDETLSVETSHCTFNPCKKCLKISCKSNIYKLASTVTVILAYFKLIDNLKDSNLFKKILYGFLFPYLAMLKRKAKKKYPDIYKKIEEGMAEQFRAEKESDSSLDKSADATAKMLGWLFAYGENNNKDDLYKFGYQLGRTVYFLDAFDDYERDIKSNSFNPFKNCDNLVESATTSVNLSIGALSEFCESYEKNRFSPIIDNIIYDGLNYQLQRIIKKYRGDNCE